jgi:uncharacterized protein YacL
MIMGSVWAKYIVELRAAMPNTPAPTWDLLAPWMFMGGLGGIITAMGVFLILHVITQELWERIAPALLAIVMGLVCGYFLSQYLFFWFPNADPLLRIFVTVTTVLIFGFAGIFLGLTRASNWESLINAVQKRVVESGAMLKLVDTSVIIDGRIVDICMTGFVDGQLLVPRFVLKELQNIADSSDVLRRAKGRHGLDVLKALQQPESRVDVRIIEDDPKEVRDVDGKLVTLARQYGAKVLTTDFNLNKVAQIEGVRVLNINDLANALKPVVLPDEQMQVKIIKEGKEPNQGVGYLDDGTMIVVDGGRNYLGRTVEVLVTSVLQTAAGRMIFTRFNNIIP